MNVVGINWQYHDSVATTGWLNLDGRCVAVVGQRLDGAWHCTVNRHLEPPRWQTVICRRRERAEHWAERWAGANAGRLRDDAEHVARASLHESWGATARLTSNDVEKTEHPSTSMATAN